MEVKEVNKMEYQKPELLVLGNAVELIQSDKPQGIDNVAGSDLRPADD